MPKDIGEITELVKDKENAFSSLYAQMDRDHDLES